MINVAVAGAVGRLGSLIVKNVVENSAIHLVQAFDIQCVGSDAGEEAGAGRTGVKITDASGIDELDADVLIDFTAPDSAVKNIEVASKKGVPVVVGTTGFSEEQKKQIEEYCQKIPAVVSPNFSVGVNVFWKIIEYATRFLGDYDIEIVEKHHKFKKDAPSGTAIKIAEVASSILKEQGKDRHIVYERSGERKDDEITVLAIRGGDVA
ncbi:MAG: 4-hydroxy-tetrahydrodipicolinate reductase, partial [Candidatus Hadarchaeota archaeon]